MKLMFMIGDSAVGKMTVGQELIKMTDFSLFYNHMMIEPVLEIFGSFKSNTIERLRQVIFEEYAKSDGYGLIFTTQMNFDDPEEWEYLNKIINLFPENTEVYYVELIAEQKVRLERNKTENRLRYKASKRDIEASNKRLISDDEKYRCVSYEGEITFKNYLRLHTDELTAEETAKKIKEYFKI